MSVIGDADPRVVPISARVPIGVSRSQVAGHRGLLTRTAGYGKHRLPVAGMPGLLLFTLLGHSAAAQPAVPDARLVCVVELRPMSSYWGPPATTRQETDGERLTHGANDAGCQPGDLISIYDLNLPPRTAASLICDFRYQIMIRFPLEQPDNRITSGLMCVYRGAARAIRQHPSVRR